jgi:hypothetical protein
MTWLITGNANATYPANFLGTTNNVPLAIRTNTAVNPADAVHITSPPSRTDARFVGIGTNTPQTPLHVVSSPLTVADPQRRTTLHVSGEVAGYSFNSGEAAGDPLTPGYTASPRAGERWVWFARMEGAQRVAQLWSGASTPSTPISPSTDLGRGPRLIVTDWGQMLLPAQSSIVSRVDFPAVPIGTLTPKPAAVPPPGFTVSPTLGREQGELVLGGVRTSIRGFDGPREDPTRPAGASLLLGWHWIRTNGNDSERWMAFHRDWATLPFIGPTFIRRLVAAVSWTAPSFNTSSDARLKTNIRQVEGALDKLERIRGVAFEWAEAESPSALADVPGKPSIGVVAQEVEEVFPEVVSIYAPDPDSEEEYKAVDYDGLTSVLIEAVKELKAENEELRSRIEALEGA